jgi:hypothetical protein
MNLSEQPPSKQWAPLKYRGEAIAEVWFKPDGEPFAISFRIPRKSFQVPRMAQLLTTENLLKAVAIPTADIGSWRDGNVAHSGMNGSNPELRNPLAPPPPDVTHLTIHVNLNPPAPGGEAVIPEAKWQALEARWNAVLGVEASIETLRMSLEGLRGEMEAEWKKTLTTDEKLHAPNADVAQWNKAKNRIHFALPKLREFIHRATWALGAPERKKLTEVFKNQSQPQVPIPEIDKVPNQLESLLKQRQALSAHGAAVYEECKRVTASVQRALRTLRSNATTNARRKTSAIRGRLGKLR